MADLTLAELNAILDKRGLRRLESLGDLSKREPQLTEILEIHDYGVFTDIVFLQSLPDGGCHNYVIRFNKNGNKGNGAVFAVLMNGTYFALVEQFRSACGRKTLEAPRGFREASDSTQSAVLFREWRKFSGRSASPMARLSFITLVKSTSSQELTMPLRTTGLWK